jgi:hypothetical protein
VSWDEKSAVFRWSYGKVTLPAGFTYQGDPSDTLEGPQDGKLIVRHDIGGYAGAYANRKDALVFEERMIDGARVWTAQRKWGRTKILVAVTFPDNGCANFYLETSNGVDGAIIDALARSFRSRETKPNSICGR